MTFSVASSGRLLPILTGARGSRTARAYEEITGTAVHNAQNLSELAVFPTREALKRLSKLEENWDGYGSDAPSATAIGNAHALIVDTYNRVIGCARRSWVNPHVSASESGEVVFEWWKRDRKLTVYVTPERVQYLRVSGPDIEEDMEDGELVGDQFVGLWLWLNA